jgi:hypothetical protein
MILWSEIHNSLRSINLNQEEYIQIKGLLIVQKLVKYNNDQYFSNVTQKMIQGVIIFYYKAMR